MLIISSYQCPECSAYAYGQHDAHTLTSLNYLVCIKCGYTGEQEKFTVLPNHEECAMEKPVDPKQACAVKKMTFDAVPISLLLHAQPGNKNGADKYGVYNWLKLEDGSMSINTYLNALQRHLILFRAGQDDTSDTGINNLDSMISGLAVLRDAMLFNKVCDDRVKLSKEQIEILEALMNNVEGILTNN